MDGFVTVLDCALALALVAFGVWLAQRCQTRVPRGSYGNLDATINPAGTVAGFNTSRLVTYAGADQ